MRGLNGYVFRMGNRGFADHVPEDCPPDSATPAEGKVYRCIKRNGIQAEDFETHFENDRRPDADLCSRCALSVLRSLDEARQFRKTMPKLGRYIAEAVLRPEHGMWKLTDKRSGHINWWPYDGVERTTLFQLVQE